MKRFLKRFLKWAAIASGLLLAAFFLWSAAYTWTTGRRLEARLAAIRQAGEPLSIADFAVATIPPETNADVLLEAAATDVEAVEKGLLALYPKMGRPTWPLKPGEDAPLEEVFRSHPRAVPQLREAAERPDYQHAFDDAATTALMTDRLIQHSTKHRAAVRVLESWSMLRLARGEGDEALAAAVASLKLSRHWERDPGFISSLTAIACSRVSAASAARVLQAAGVSVSEDGRRALDAELARHDDGDLLRRGLKTERAYALTSVAEMSASMFWLRGWMRNTLTLMFLDLFDEELAKADLGPRKSRGSWSVPSPALNRLWHPLKGLADLLRPATQSFHEAAAVRRAAARALRVLNAIQVHVPPDGDAPPDLEALGLPRETTLDPFTDEPLQVRKRPEGWLVYSVGKDLVDDGGEVKRDRDVGFGPAAIEP